MPTPTPMPDATAQFQLDASGFAQDAAYNAVQLFNSMNDGGLITLLQVMMLIAIVLGGMFVVMRKLRTMNNE